MLDKIKELTATPDLFALSGMVLVIITLFFIGGILAHSTYRGWTAEVTIHTNTLVAQHFDNVRCVDRDANYLKVHMERGDVKVYSTDQVVEIRYNDQSIVGRCSE